jgi:uncharacterized protein
MTMEFDRLTVVLLTTRAGSAERSEDEDQAIQDAHMAHLADLHEHGHLLAAGPLSDGYYRGMLLFAATVDESEAMMMVDPATQAGWFDVTGIPWTVPGGAMHFTAANFPRSMTEID